MKLGHVLKIHDRNLSTKSLSQNLGDGFLLKHNPVYSNIREAAKQAKFTFHSSRFKDYDSLSLTQLPAILAAKHIPFIDNVNPLREIETKAPKFFTLAEVPPLRTNHLFHESAHASVHGLLQKLLLQSKGAKGIQRERTLALITLMEESFANACESYANLYAIDEIHDEFLFKNTYIMESPKVRKLLLQGTQTFGTHTIFKVLFFSFLHSNFLATPIAMQNLGRVVRLSYSHQAEYLQLIRSKDLVLLQKIFRTGLELDPEFTGFTNQFCLRLLGVKTALLKLFDFDFLALFELNPTYQSCIDRMTSIAVGKI